MMLPLFTKELVANHEFQTGTFIIALPLRLPEEFKDVKDFREVYTGLYLTIPQVDKLQDLIPPDVEEFGLDIMNDSCDSVSCSSSDESLLGAEDALSSVDWKAGLEFSKPGISLDREFFKPPTSQMVASLPRNEVHICHRCKYTTSSFTIMKLHVCPRYYDTRVEKVQESLE